MLCLPCLRLLHPPTHLRPYTVLFHRHAGLACISHRPTALWAATPRVPIRCLSYQHLLCLDAPLFAAGICLSVIAINCLPPPKSPYSATRSHCLASSHGVLWLQSPLATLVPPHSHLLLLKLGVCAPLYQATFDSRPSCSRTQLASSFSSYEPKINSSPRTHQ